MLGMPAIPEGFKQRNIIGEDENLGADFFNADGKGSMWCNFKCTWQQMKIK